MARPETVGLLRLSHSSREMLTSCPQKFVFYKSKVPQDPDAPDDENLRFGSALHYNLELTNRDRSKQNDKIFRDSLTKHQMTKESHRIYAALMSYYDMHEVSGLKCLKSEFKIENDLWLGFIDEILVDNDGGWWIGDTKTASTVDVEELRARLGRNPQLSIYAAFRHLIASQLKLDVNQFQGCRYRPVIKFKSDVAIKKGETEAEFYLRKKAEYQGTENTKARRPLAYDFAVRYTEDYLKYLDTEFMYSLESAAYLSRRIMNREAMISRNYSACISYFQPCPWWSHCHGKQYHQFKEEGLVPFGTDLGQITGPIPLGAPWTPIAKTQAVSQREQELLTHERSRAAAQAEKLAQPTGETTQPEVAATPPVSGRRRRVSEETQVPTPETVVVSSPAAVPEEAKPSSRRRQRVEEVKPEQVAAPAPEAPAQRRRSRVTTPEESKAALEKAEREVKAYRDLF